MYLFIKKGLRGGISYIAKRYSKANKKYMKNHDPIKPSKFISYKDMNNLRGWEMRDYLPYGGFKQLKNDDKLLLNTNELHYLHNDYPLAPENLPITMTFDRLL